MKTKSTRWARLFTALILVASLSLFLMPTAVAQEPCDPTPPDSCLQVNIISPEDGLEVEECTYFWVNASIAKPPAASTCLDVQVSMTYDAAYAELIAGVATPDPFDLTTCDPVKDFWWLFHCTSPNDVTITVTADSNACCEGSDQIVVHQVEPPCDTKLEIEIIECPPGPVDVSDVFGVKALVKNLTDEPIGNVNAYITIEGYEDPSGCPAGTAELVGCPTSFNLDCIQPGCEEEVGWTLHCTGAGWVKAVVNATAVCGCDSGAPLDECEIKEAECLIHQLMPAKCDVEISGVPEKLCTNCDENCFTVTATISEVCGDTGIYGGCAKISASGNVSITGPLTKQVVDVPAGGSQVVTWNVCCTALNDWNNPTIITVEFEGYDVNTDDLLECSDDAEVYQTDLMVEIVSPADGTLFNVCNEYDVVMTVKNCEDENIFDVFASLCLNEAPNVILDSLIVDLTFDDPGCQVNNPDTLTAVKVDGACYEVVIPCLCACCEATLTWHVSCKGTAMEDCDVETAMETLKAWTGFKGPPSVDRDYDEIEVGQMWKAHLSAGLLVVEGTMTDSNFQGAFPIEAIPVGDNFTLVMPVVNLGQAAAENIHINLGVVGNVETQTPLEQDIPEIPCGGAAKLFWEFKCAGPGPVIFTVLELSGTDGNTGEAIPGDNIEVPCPLEIEQIPIIVRIIQPLTCTDFTVGETFTVKAEVCNNSGTTLEGVTAILHWMSEVCTPDSNCPEPGGMKPAIGQQLEIDLNNLTPQECSEATWQMICCAPTDVEFYVEIKVDSPVMSADSGSEVIHQQSPGSLCCEILSPELQRTDLFPPGCKLIGPYIATSQDFSVTARISNKGGFPINVTDVDLFAAHFGPPPAPQGTFSILVGPTPAPSFVLNPGASKVITWTLHCDSAGLTGIELKVEGEDTLCLLHECSDLIGVTQYKAAHLEVALSDYPATVEVGDDFTITATITNTGEADAWEAAAVLSVFPEGSVRVTEGGYTKQLGNLVGHGEDGSQTVIWNLQCKELCNSTITVTATGYDEYGFHTKQRWSECCFHEVGDGWVLYLEPEAGLPIQSRFIEPASVTVKQLEGTGGDGGTGGQQSGNHDIALETGWNLVSSPYYIPSASDAPATVLAGIWDNLNAVWAYDACAAPGARWSNTATSGPPGTLTHIRDGQGYWVQMNAPDTLSIAGDVNPPPPEMPPTYPVCTGWNLIGFKLDAPKAANLYLLNVSFGVIYGFDNGSYFSVQAAQDLLPGNGYWVAVFAPGTIYP